MLYDISWLGHAYGKPLGATGLVRVVEALGAELAANPECELTLCAGDSFGALAGCLAALGEESPLDGVPIAYPSFESKYQMAIHRVLSAIDREKKPRVWQRMIRRLLNEGTARWQPAYGTFDRKSLNDAEVYHSSFLGIPPVVRRTRHLKKVLTVYDLIPFLFPELCADGAATMLQATLDSLTSEDVVLCISNATRVDLCNRLTWLDPARVFVTYLGASKDFRPCTDAKAQERVRLKYKIPTQHYLLTVGALEPRKGIEHVIDSFTGLIEQEGISDLSLVVAGARGWKYDRIFERVGKRNKLSSDRIILTGRVEDVDLPALYNGALAFVFMSLYEGFGLPALEAMQCGAPVIASNTSSFPEVVGDAGILLPPRDTEALCQAVLELYRSEALRDRLSAAGLERARRFSWGDCARKTLNAYKA